MKLRQASFLAVALALGACSSEGDGDPAGAETAALGENPLTISENTVLGVSGTLLGDDAATPATSLWVKRGATLLLYSADDASPGQVTFTLANALVVDGTLVMAQVGETLDATSLDATVGAVSIAGRIEASGGDVDFTVAGAAEGEPAATIAVTSCGSTGSSGDLGFAGR